MGGKSGRFLAKITNTLRPVEAEEEFAECCWQLPASLGSLGTELGGHTAGTRSRSPCPHPSVEPLALLPHTQLGPLLQPLSAGRSPTIIRVNATWEQATSLSLPFKRQPVGQPNTRPDLREQNLNFDQSLVIQMLSEG